jgi:prepilin-type N-terminal cleavage/methylation domain-containing protein
MRRTRQGRRSARRGFTLIELVVAITISALVILAGRMLLENLGAAADRIDRAAQKGAGDANGERLLRALVAQIDVGIQGATFAGDEQSAQFTSWCQSPRGWRERCRITLSIEMVNGSPALTTTLPGNDRVVLYRAERALRLRYLVDPSAGGTWFVKWGDGLLAPRAIGVIADSDTLIIRIGDHG